MDHYTVNETISFLLRCKTQGELDYYWGKLSARPVAEQCGWLKDEYGPSRRVVPTVMDEMMKATDQEKLARVTEAKVLEAH